MLMMRLTFPELDWESGVRTRATLVLLDLQLHARKVQQLNVSRRPVNNTAGRCFAREVEYFRIIQHAGNVFVQCSVNDLAGNDNSQTEEALLVTLQGDTAQKENDTLRNCRVFLTIQHAKESIIPELPVNNFPSESTQNGENGSYRSSYFFHLYNNLPHEENIHFCSCDFLLLTSYRMFAKNGYDLIYTIDGRMVTSFG
jgi:hypothetical protein